MLEYVAEKTKKRDWEVFELLNIEELNSTEVAKKKNMTGAAVRQIKSRLLKRIREEYEKLGIQDDLPEQ
jgi:DNA-directed RNA polymerase specialized sigma subunit